jgi:heterodisulfide reductase subunit A
VARRIGVYICHCGTNIAATVDVKALVEHAGAQPGVEAARDQRYTCSDPGQQTIIDDIRSLGLDRVVVAACSPRMHERTFGAAIERAGLSRYVLQICNIREGCSWVTRDRATATSKARALLTAAIDRSRFLEPLTVRSTPVRPEVLVIGGGIAGLQAALEIADSGKKVFLVEREPHIGGKMTQFDKTFPTLDCAACIMTPRTVAAGSHRNIDLMTSSEVETVEGAVGDFTVTVRRKARRVDVEKCNGCGACWNACPAVIAPRRRVIRLRGVATALTPALAPALTPALSRGEKEQTSGDR